MMTLECCLENVNDNHTLRPIRSFILSFIVLSSESLVERKSIFNEVHGDTPTNTFIAFYELTKETFIG